MMSCRPSPDACCFPDAQTCIDSAGSAYELRGGEGAPVAVLIHGLGLTRRMWRDIASRLVARYRVLAYDLCGHGESRACGRPPDLSLLSEQLRRLLDELSISKAALIGFSLGGMINRRFAMDHPGRVLALVILNSPHERSPEQQALVEERAARTDAGGTNATIDATLARWFTEAFIRERADVVARVKECVLANDARDYAAFRRLLASGVLELIRPEPPISTPALVMTCAQDSGSTPEMSQAIAGEISGAQLVIEPDLRHLGLLQEPERFAAPVETFLQGALA
ncbi:MAG: alpha/beta fold hydrolase [Hyphomicrobiales bacterium]|nr:alpha/beta fold hydrolase [Hyphomicrobiales bacterium]MCY4037875.1 alpha/beta fold hydrolase [Hyphomicrobiales bacterium]